MTNLLIYNNCHQIRRSVDLQQLSLTPPLFSLLDTIIYLLFSFVRLTCYTEMICLLGRCPMILLLSRIFEKKKKNLSNLRRREHIKEDNSVRNVLSPLSTGVCSYRHFFREKTPFKGARSTGMRKRSNKIVSFFYKWRKISYVYPFDENIETHPPCATRYKP